MTPRTARLGPTLPTDPTLLLEALIALAIQLLIADNPDLLLPPEIPRLYPPPRLSHARAVVDLLRETHHALARYRDLAPRTCTRPAATDTTDDDIPF